MFVGARSLQRKGKKKEAGKEKNTGRGAPKGRRRSSRSGFLVPSSSPNEVDVKKDRVFRGQVEQSLVLSLELAKVRFEVPRRLAPVSSSKHTSWCFCQQDEISNRTKYPQSTSRSCPFSFPFLVFQKFVHRTCYAWYNVSSTCTTNPQTVRFLSKYNFLTNCISQLVMSLQSLPLL